jgi:conjugal transfer pilus assembly protein TraU
MKMCNRCRQIILILSLCAFLQNSFATCAGHFVNPITDICWDCLFPISIGNIKVASGGAPDTENPSWPIEICRMPVGYRIGLNIGYWEPVALTDITPTPYCMVNLGGFTINIGHSGQGGKQHRNPADSGAFYYAHWYKYPLIFWLQILMSAACMQTGEFDIGYLTELDPMWNDDEWSFVINPEAVLFGNQITQTACAVDAAKSQAALPMDKLFWCAGTQGGMYPLDGTVFDEKGPIQSAVLLSERMAFKLHREGLLWDSVGDSGSMIDGPICKTYLAPIMPKSRYRYQMTNTVSAADKCYQFGHDVVTWEGGHDFPSQGNNFGFLIWQKRNCTFL